MTEEEMLYIAHITGGSGGNEFGANVFNIPHPIVADEGIEVSLVVEE